MFQKSTFLFSLGILFLACASQKPNLKRESSLEIMFYNVENFFDTIDDPRIDDREYLPTSDKRWNTAKYNTKLNNICKVIESIDKPNYPDLIGLCEIENRSIMTAISNKLDQGYAISHFESPDHRGIDVGLLYKDSLFHLLLEKPIFVQINGSKNTNIEPVTKSKGNTRNILKTVLAGKTDTFCIYVCHFPSRRGGQNETEYKRVHVARVLKNDIEKQLSKYPKNQIIIMGDFNDEPLNNSILNVLSAKLPGDKDAKLVNLFLELDKEKEGSYKYRGKMNMLDQIIISNQTWSKEVEQKIFNPSWLIQTGKYSGFPLRTFGGKNYLAGYSDHFPVFASIPLN